MPIQLVVAGADRGPEVKAEVEVLVSTVPVSIVDEVVDSPMQLVDSPTQLMDKITHPEDFTHRNLQGHPQAKGIKLIMEDVIFVQAIMSLALTIALHMGQNVLTA